MVDNCINSKLEIPLDISSSLLLGAREGKATDLLHILADVLGLKCDAENNGFCSAIIESQAVAHKEGGAVFRRIVRDEQQLRIYPVAYEHPEREKEALLLRALLFGAVSMKILNESANCVLFHGSLLEDGNDAILLFGESGIGKSTTRNRWIEEGGTSIADDALLCFRNGDEFYARCLPTWSDWFNNGSSSRRYPINEPRRIKSVLWLSRGKESQYTTSVAPALWHAQLMSAMTLFSFAAMRRFTQDEKSAYLDHIWSFICKIDKTFPQRGLFAHLDFSLKDTLLKEFQQ